MAEVKITKKVVLEAIKAAAEGMDFGEVVSAADVITYANTAIAQLDAKAAKAKEKAAEKRADGDALRAVVEDAVSDEYRTIDAITAKVAETEGYEDVTKSKVTARLTQLVKSGAIHKVQGKTEDNRKVMMYALGEAPAEDAE